MTCLTYCRRRACLERFINHDGRDSNVKAECDWLTVIKIRPKLLLLTCVLHQLLLRVHRLPERPRDHQISGTQNNQRHHQQNQIQKDVEDFLVLQRISRPHFPAFVLLTWGTEKKVLLSNLLGSARVRLHHYPDSTESICWAPQSAAWTAGSGTKLEKSACRRASVSAIDAISRDDKWRSIAQRLSPLVSTPIRSRMSLWMEQRRWFYWSVINRPNYYSRNSTQRFFSESFLLRFYLRHRTRR